MKYRFARRVALLAMAAITLCITCLDAAPYTFVGTSGTNYWDDEANWSPTGVPGPGDSATISDVGSDPMTIFGSDATADDLTVSGTTIKLDGLITVTHDFEWQAGSISGDVMVAGGAVLNISGTAGKVLDEFATLTNSGTATWTGSGRILGGGGCTLENDGTFYAAGDNSFGYSAGSNTATFQNNGTLIKSSGAGTTYIGGYWAYSGTGTINVQTGTIELGQVSNQTHFFGDGTVISGSGHRVVVSDAIDVEGFVQFDSGATLEIAEGAQLSTDANGYFYGPGTLQWSGGMIESGNYEQGIVSTGTDTELLISGTAQKVLDQAATFYNNGPAIWTGTGSVMVNAATFNNEGSFTVEADSSFTCNETGTFNNVGTFLETSSGGTGFDGVDLFNSGTLAITQPGAGIFSNSVYVQNPRGVFKVAFSGSNYASLNASEVILSGTLQVTVPNNSPQPAKGTVASVLTYGVLDTGGLNVIVPVGVKLKPNYTQDELQLIVQDPAKPLAVAALSGKVQGVTTKRPSSSTLQIKGNFVVRNTGNKPAARFHLDLYSSDATNFSPSIANYVKTFTVPGIPAGGSYTVPFKTTVTGTKQEYLIFDIDAQNKVVELNRDNNTVLYTAPYH